MTIKNLYPTSRPTLNLDFANTKALDPRITFTRASIATYVDDDGLIKSAATNAARFDHNPATGESLGLLVEEARTNKESGSEFHDWAVVAGTAMRYAGVAPNGTFTATMLSPSSTIQKTTIPDHTPANTYSSNWSVTFYAKPVTASTGTIMFNQGGTGNTLTFNFATLQFTGASVFVNAASYTAFANGWYKITLAPAYLYNAYFFGLYTDASSVLVWGFQLENATFPTSYIPTPATFTSRASTATYYDSAGVIQTAGSGVARSAAFFPDSSGVMRSAGLLLEAAGTNLLQQSAAISTTPWTLVNAASVTANTTVAPDGTTTGDTLGGTTVNSYTEQTIPWTASGNWTLSLYMKAGTSTRSKVYIERSLSQVHGTSINWTAGVPSFTATFGCTPSYQSVGSGWYRINLQLTSVVHTSTNSLRITSDFVSGTGTVIIWGVQAEENAYATSYIPTTTATVTRAADVSSSATVTRSADVANITGTNFSSWFNSSKGTFFAESQCDRLVSAVATSAYNQTANTCFALGTGSPSAGRAYLPYYEPVSNNTISVGLFQYNGTTTNFGPQLTNVIPFSALNSIQKVAFYTDPANQQYAISTKGLLATLNTNFGLTGDYSYTFANMMTIGYTSPNYTGWFSGRIKKLSYYPTKLSNSEIQTLTS